MRRIGILTAGGDTPALNATIYGAVERASALKIEVFGIIKGFDGILNPDMPHVRLNPLFSSIPELDPCLGGTILGASRTYVDPDNSAQLKEVCRRFERLGIEGLICIGGDGTINGMQPLSEFFPCVLAPKTIDNDLGLNYVDEPNHWARDPEPDGGFSYRRIPDPEEITLDEIVNYATPGYATAVFVVAQSIERIRTTAESHRRIAIIEVMGRESGYIALGSAYGQPDIILIPEVPLNVAKLEQRVKELYDLQKHVVIVIGEGVVDEQGRQLGATSSSVDPAGNIVFSGAAEELQNILAQRLGDAYFQRRRRHSSAAQAIFTRKVGHTQRGGRPIQFDRFYATQLGGKAVDLLVQGQNNMIATLQWSHEGGFCLDSIPAHKLRDQWNMIHARQLHPSFYDAHRFQPSKLGVQYLLPIFTNSIGADDVEHIRTDLFSPGHLATRYQSVNIDIHKRIHVLPQADDACV
jgi:ATP-dependent phosphofructokinase / diphosphate-dependent phosphofructokinase